MTAIDFAITIAIGTILSATILPKASGIPEGCFALGVLFFFQWGISVLRRKSKKICKLTENSPLLIMKDGEILDENLKKANLTRADLLAKLRESNAYNFSKVKAVIFESTGDVSVLHGDDEIDSKIFDDVQEK